MMKIILPTGTTHIQYGDLADLIANAIWPNDPLKAGFAWFSLEKELAQAVESGALALHDGEAVLPDELRIFLADRRILVEIEEPKNDDQRLDMKPN